MSYFYVRGTGYGRYLPKGFRKWIDRRRERSAGKDDVRQMIASKYLRGSGIEIGALHYPTQVLPAVHVTYVDLMSTPDLRKYYPELNQKPMVTVEVVDNGERLSKFEDDSQDFLIANHMIEHCQDPIGTLIQHFRVLKEDGILFMAVPDKRFTFDKERPVTEWEHLVQDHEAGPEGSRLAHYKEYVQFVSKVDPEHLDQAVQERLAISNDHIHYHVWTQTAWLQFLLHLQSYLSFEIEAVMKNGIEIINILRKTTKSNLSVS